MPVKQLLKEMSLLSAPSGAEDEAADYFEEKLREGGWKASRDVLGNVIGVKGVGAKKILFAAHLDAPSLAVAGVTKEGFIRFVKVGGLYDGLLGCARVVIHAKKRLKGVIGLKPPHLMKEEDSKKVVEFEQLFIDAGLKDADEAKKLGVKPGVPIAFDASFDELENGLVLGTAFDNRAGCAVLLAVARELKVPKDATVYLVGTVREETGLWGAGAVVFEVKPDLAVAVDVTLVSGTPDLQEDRLPAKLGGGPVLGVLEGSGRGLIMPKKLVDWFEKVAEKHKIPLQFEAIEKGATDASRMQYMRSGFLAAGIGVPSRYIHSPNEVVCIKDLQEAKKLVDALVAEFPSSGF